LFEFLHSWIGKWEVVIRDLNNNVIERTNIKPNLIMDDGINMLRDLISGAITDGEIKYIALGDSDTTPAINQHTLGNEKFKKLITSQTNQTGIGILLTTVFISDSEANDFKTEEIAWFAGISASETIDSGIMVARVLYSRQKNNLESWTINRTDTFKRGV